MGFHASSVRGRLISGTVAALLAFAIGATAEAADSTAILGALRLSGIITGGTLPTSSPEFDTMVGQVAAGNYYAAAMTAIDSQYGSGYLLRRLAFQMQNPSYSAGSILDDDNDATAFLIAHFAGAGGIKSSTLSKVWSDDVTCTVNVVRNGTTVNVHAADLTAAEHNTIDWRTALTCSAGQTAVQGSNTDAKMTIPPADVGGYVTLSDRPGDNSFAQVGATAGTNLRYIENIWMVATGMDLLAFASTEAPAQNAPRFVPENDPHFLIGNGQTACIACHGGGLASVDHGYATVADLFDFTNKGLTYIDKPTTGTRKSLGSTPGNRQKTLTCDLSRFTVCNPDSVGVDPNQGWDLASTWANRGMLTTLGWTGATAGQGLNSLGEALGKAGIVYSNFVKRVMKEVCPLGAINDADVKAITASFQSSDDVKRMIAQVASNGSCR